VYLQASQELRKLNYQDLVLSIVQKLVFRHVHKRKTTHTLAEDEDNMWIGEPCFHA
jgi:hypothetical protein